MPEIFSSGDGRLSQIEKILDHCKGGHITENEATMAIAVIVRQKEGDFVGPPFVSAIRPPIVADEFGETCPN